MKLTRRQIMRLFARAGFVASFGPMATMAVAQDTKDRFDPAIRRTFIRFLDTLIPDENGSPGAETSGVADILATEAEGMPRILEFIDEGCRWLDAEAQETGALSFAELDAENRETIVRRASLAEPTLLQRQFFDVVLEVALSAYYATPAGWQVIGYDGPPQPFGFPDYAEPPEGRL